MLPSEGQSYYCLAAAGIARSAEAYVPVGVDYCALAPTMIDDRDLGAPNYAPITLAGKTTLGVATPVYSAGRPGHGGVGETADVPGVAGRAAGA